MIKACEFTAPAEPEGKKAYIQRRPTAIRDKAIILIFMDTGMRVGEMSRLQVGDVTLETGEIEIKPHGRGMKSSGRVVYLGKRARKLLWQYLAERDNIQDFDPLFPMGIQAIRSMIVRLCEKIGVRGGPHKFRHTFGINYLRNGGDVFTLQRILGHSTLDMVKRYLKLAQTDAAEAHRMASPADRWKL